MTTPIRTFIDKIARHSNDFLSGFGQAFSLWPSDSLDRYLVPEDVGSASMRTLRVLAGTWSQRCKR
ncbi:hypothetical protein [Xylella fastidiosa]|uniref:hypothetical protein n=1 Tax=Xylella fastidiosa TaxID=2371 RepID=UPI00398494D4